jgi:hypothetical protein
MSVCTAWATEEDLTACGYEPPVGSEEVVARALMQASEILYRLSGSRWPGECEELLRPCGAPSQATLGALWMLPWVPLQTSPGVWVNMPGCGCYLADDCGCPPIPQINLGRDDVQSVELVTIGTETLLPEDYRLDHGRWLVRVDGGQWPCCQDLRAAPGEEGAFAIEIIYGQAPDTGGIRAAAVLASEFVKACLGDGSCRLPTRVQTITRQGVTMALIDPLEFLTNGRTGLYEVDLWLAAVNPEGLRRRSTAWSPEMPRGRRFPAPSGS